MFLEYLLTLQRKVLWPSAGSRRVGKGGGVLRRGSGGSVTPSPLPKKTTKAREACLISSQLVPQ